MLQLAQEISFNILNLAIHVGHQFVGHHVVLAAPKIQID